MHNEWRITRERDCAVDFVKGVLVEVMILFHVMNYFIGTEHVVLKYLDFVTGGFVFITGYVISAFSVAKYGSSSFQLYRRLLLRGVKMVMLFTLVNVAINLVIERNYNNVELGIGRFLENTFSIYIIGYKQLAAFEILLPIAYVLMISPLLLVVCRAGRSLMMLVISILLLYCTLAEGVPFNLIYVSIGLNGFALGLLLKGKYRYGSDENHHKLLFVCLAVLYCGIITIFEQAYPIYVLGIIAIVGAIYLIGRDLDYDKSVWRAVVLCGEYSLVAYLSQIVFLQALFRLSTNVALPISVPLCAFIITNVFVFMVCASLAFLRGRSLFVDRTYKIVFN